jgi:hypothetical protein
MDFGGVLKRIAGFLDGRGEPWAVVGGVGLAALGLPRTTLDLDLAVGEGVQGGLVTSPASTARRSAPTSFDRAWRIDSVSSKRPSEESGTAWAAWSDRRTAEEVAAQRRLSVCGSARGPLDFSLLEPRFPCTPPPRRSTAAGREPFRLVPAAR